MKEKKSTIKVNYKRLIISLIIIAVIILLIIALVNKIKNNNSTNNSGDIITNNESHEAVDSGENAESLDNLTSTIRNLKNDELLQGYTLYEKEDHVNMNNLLNLEGADGYTFIKETDSEYSEISVTKVKNEEDQDSVLLKYLDIFEKLKKEKTSKYGKSFSDISRFSLKRTRGITYFIISSERDNLEKLIIAKGLDI